MGKRGAVEIGSLVFVLGATITLPLAANPPDSGTTDGGVTTGSLRRIEGLDPPTLARAAVGAATPLHLLARGLVPGVRVQVGPHTLPEDRVVINAAGAALSLPHDLAVGLHVVRVHWPDGTTLCARLPLAVREESCRLRDVPFQKNSSELEGATADPSADEILAEDVACIVRTWGEQPILALGFASRDGLETSNTNLSQRRAEAVRSRIRAHLPLMSVQALGLGQALPIQLGDAEPDLAKNRRVMIISGKGLPCQPVRLSIESDGSLAAPSRAVLSAAAQCYTDRGVTSALVVAPAPSTAADSGAEIERTNKLARAVKESMATAVRGAVPPLVQLSYASVKEREVLGRVFGAVAPPAAGSFADVYPIGWLTGSGQLQPTEPNEPTCPSEVAPPVLLQSVLQPMPAPGPAPVWPGPGPARGIQSRDAFGQVRFGGMRALDQTHVGGALRAGRSVIDFGPAKSTSIVLGLSLGVFGGEKLYLIADDLRSIFLLQLNGVAGISHRIGPIRLEAALLPGLLLPAASAFLADADGTVAWRLSDSAELLGTFGGGVSIWPGSDFDLHWLAEAGMGWWF